MKHHLLNSFTNVSSIKSRCFGCLLLIKLALSTSAQIPNLVSFNVGTTPMGGLVQATDGNLYGATITGGSNNAGTIFGVDTNGNYFQLYSFTGGGDGAYTYATLI